MDGVSTEIVGYAEMLDLMRALHRRGFHITGQRLSLLGDNGQLARLSLAIFSMMC